MVLSEAQRSWNDRAAAPPRVVQRPGRCTTDGCGTLYAGTTPEGMHRVAVKGSREPERVYCSQFCVEYGQALAELRPVTRGGGC